MGCSIDDRSVLEKGDSNQKTEERKKIEVKKVKSKDAKKSIIITFQSDDGNINYFLSCNEDDIFKDIANKLFEEKKEFKEYWKYFFI